MLSEFIHNDFLLQTETAKYLYHQHAAKMPIYDYHCHLPVQQIAEDVKFKNITQIWLYGDHYKWRAMRTNGVDERYCTGDASDWEKFRDVGTNRAFLPSQSALSLDAYGVKKAFRHQR